MKQRSKEAEVHVRSNPSQPTPPNEQQQTAVERSEQAALLSCQVSDGGMVWGGRETNLESSCSLLTCVTRLGCSSHATKWKPELPSWNELEPSANFTNKAVSQDDTYQPPAFKDKSRRKLQLRKLVRLPSSILRQKVEHNTILDSSATSSFIKPDGRAQSTGQPSNKK